MNDELRSILGDKMFDELSTLGSTADDLHLEGMSPRIVERLADIEFIAKIPIKGSEALLLVAAFVHLIETGCDGCREQVEDFTATFITSLWELLQQAYTQFEESHE